VQTRGALRGAVCRRMVMTTSTGPLVAEVGAARNRLQLLMIWNCDRVFCCDGGDESLAILFGRSAKVPFGINGHVQLVRFQVLT
jgi:hypothetical protein